MFVRSMRRGRQICHVITTSVAQLEAIIVNDDGWEHFSESREDVARAFEKAGLTHHTLLLLGKDDGASHRDWRTWSVGCLPADSPMYIIHTTAVFISCASRSHLIRSIEHGHARVDQLTVFRERTSVRCQAIPTAKPVSIVLLRDSFVSLQLYGTVFIVTSVYDATLALHPHPHQEASILNMKRRRLMRKITVLGSIVLSVLILSALGFADEGEQHRKGTHMKVSGVVSKVQSGLVTVKTPWGTMTFTSATGPQKLEVGEEVEMQVNENNAVIDVHRKGAPAHFHRYVTGNFTYTAPDRKEIKLWTPEGEKTFDVQSGRSKMSTLEEGTPVTIELNEAGKVIDIHRFTVEMTFDEHPRTKPGYVIQVDGTVSKIQSGVIYVKTPAGQYTISAKTAPADAAVGDEVSLWVNEENMVIDHHGKEKHKKGTHRLIFGKLIYVGRTKDQIKLQTPEGEKVFPLERMEVKTKPIAEGSHIVVELNEEGTVVDLRKAQ